MNLTDNINYLKKYNPKALLSLSEYEAMLNSGISKLEETREGMNTLVVSKDNREVYLHSKYNPLKEAESIVETYKDIESGTNVIFYGTGLGYHIKLFLEEYKNIKYYVYEPIPDIMYRFLSNFNFYDFKDNRLLGVSLELEDFRSDISRLIDLNIGELLIIVLPAHKQNFINEYKNFIETFLKSIKDKKQLLATNYSFQKRWIINSMKNFGEILSTPNILIEKKGKFKDKPAILVAAGPSLNEEIEDIRYIKENGLAYIFSVGSAINTLIYHNIYPHAVTTYDPGVFNQNVFKTIKEKGIKEIPMIFGSSVGYETIENYPGDKYHMLTSQDTVSNYYLKDMNGKDINIVQDAPTIAVVTLQLMYELGFRNILLVGQNLGYRGKERHSEGITHSSSLTEEEIKKGIWVTDVYGNEILTNEGFNSMRQQMENYIKYLPNINVINTTKGGSHIEGTKFIELQKIIERNLTEKIVQEDWLDSSRTNYDRKHLELKMKNMDGAYNKALKINKDYNDILNRIGKAINNRNFSQAEKLYVKLDKELRKIENNDFYKTFILPMNRVQYKILADSIDSLNDERDLYEKGKRILESFKKFIDICAEDIEMIEPIYEEMKQNINKYCNTDSEV